MPVHDITADQCRSGCQRQRNGSQRSKLPLSKQVDSSGTHRGHHVKVSKPCVHPEEQPGSKEPIATA
eukprot:2176003-Rhodomonas_salina.2